MRLQATRNVARPISLQNVTPDALKARIGELADLVDEVAGVLRDMGAEESSITMTLGAGYRYGYVQGTGERPDEEVEDGNDGHGGAST